MVFARPNLEQPVCRDAPVTADGRTIQTDARGLQVVHAQHVLIQSPSKARQCLSSLTASSTVARRSSPTSNGCTGCPVHSRSVWRRCWAQGATWLGRTEQRYAKFHITC